MRGSSFLAVLSFAAGAFAAVSSPVTVKGNAFWANGKRFYVRGVDYQPGGSSELYDPLATDNCLRDVPLFKELGLNTIRVYTIDNSKNHDTCMKALSDAGIYLILDVNTPKFAINRDYPKESYNEIYLQHVWATVDVMGKYTNLLGFFAANEVINNLNTTSAATYVKATVRDLKAYIKKHASRTIPVGYSAADVAENRMQQAHYFNCGDDAARIDFLGMNDYSWCGSSSFTLSGWNQKLSDFNSLKSMNQKVPIPTDDGGYHADNSPSECPTEDGLWQATTTLPDMPSAASVYMESGAGKPRGTSGPSNQWTPGKGSAPSDQGYQAGPTSTGTTGDAPAGMVPSIWLASFFVVAALGSFM